MDLNKEVKSKRGQTIIIGAVIGAGVGLLIGNLLAGLVIGAALGYVWSLQKPKKS